MSSPNSQVNIRLSDSSIKLLNLLRKWAFSKSVLVFLDQSEPTKSICRSDSSFARHLLEASLLQLKFDYENDQIIKNTSVLFSRGLSSGAIRTQLETSSGLDEELIDIFVAIAYKRYLNSKNQVISPSSNMKMRIKQLYKINDNEIRYLLSEINSGD